MIRSWAILLLLSAPLSAMAQSAREPPTDGERAAMGQTCVAARAGAGAAYSNPAALATIDGDQLDLASFAGLTRVGGLGLADASGALSVGTPPSWGGASWTPSAASVAHALTGELRLVLALSAQLTRADRGRVVASREGLDAGLSSSTRFERELSWDQLALGPSAAIRLPTLHLRLGLSAFGLLSELGSHAFLSQTASAETGLARSEWSEVDDRRQTVGAALVFGAQWEPIAGLVLGASGRPPSLTVARSGSIHRVSRFIGADGGGGTLTEGAIDQAALPDPAELRVGAELSLLPRLRFAVELSYAFDLHGPSLGTIDATASDLTGDHPPSLELSRLEERLSTRDVLNVSAGASFELDSRWMLAAGFLSDRSLTGPSQLASTDNGRTVAWVRWPKRDQWLGTLGATLRLEGLSISGWLAAGLVQSRSSELLLAAGNDSSVSGLIARAGLSVEWRGE